MLHSCDKIKCYWGGATIAQWIRLRLPSSGTGLESQAYHQHFYCQILNYTCHCIKLREGWWKKQKWTGLAHILKDWMLVFQFKSKYYLPNLDWKYYLHSLKDSNLSLLAIKANLYFQSILLDQSCNALFDIHCTFYEDFDARF